MARPIVIDVEASGFGRGSYPIEVGVAMPTGETHCMIICPAPQWQHWDSEAESLHGISRDTLIQHGHDPIDVARQLNQWLAGTTVYSDAWGNDSSWLGLLFDYADMSQHFKLDSLRALLTEQQLAIWHDVKDAVFKESRFDRHRASNDALVLQKTYCRTAEKTKV